MKRKKTRRLTRNQKIIAAFITGDNVDQLAADYGLTWDQVEAIIRHHCRKLRGYR